MSTPKSQEERPKFRSIREIRLERERDTAREERDEERIAREDLDSEWANRYAKLSTEAERLRGAIAIVTPYLCSHQPSDPVAFFLDTADALQPPDGTEEEK